MLKTKKMFLSAGLLILAVSVLFGLVYSQQTAGEMFEKALFLEEAQGDLQEAIGLYTKVIETTQDEALAAKAQLQIGICYEKLGKTEAVKAFQKVVDNYPDQREAVKLARERLSILQNARAVLDKGSKEFSLKRINASSDVDAYDVSPDGRYVSYTDWMGGLLGIYEVATGKKRLLDEKGSQLVLGSCFSPDGKWIAYDAYNEEAFWDLRIIDFEGKEPRVLYKEKGFFICPVGWSPDGKSVLVGLAKTDGQQMTETQIALVSIDDGAVHRMKTLEHPNPRGGLSAVFSPDGRYIAFGFRTDEESQSHDHDISVISMDEKEEIALIKNPADDSLLDWTPDGKNILFVSDRKGTKDLWMIGVEEGKPKGEPVRIKTNVGNISPLGFIKNGSFFYGVRANSSDIYWAELDAEKGVLTSSPTKVVLPSLGANSAPEWSPDGKYMAYVSISGAGLGQGDHSLRIFSLETGDFREVYRSNAVLLDAFSGLRWSPDGSSLLVLAFQDQEGNANACITDIETGTMKKMKLDVAGQRPFSPAWSRDMKTVYYIDSKRVMALDVETGQCREITTDTYSPSHPDTSPDGKTLAYAVGSREVNAFILRTVDVSSGEKHDVVQIQNKGEVTDPTDPSQLEKVRQVRGMCWAPDGRSLYCYILLWPASNKAEDQIVELWNFPIDGSAPKRFYEGNEFAFGNLRFHPDGKRFAFRMKSSRYEIWEMENFLPHTKEGK